MLLTDTQVWRLGKNFVNGPYANIELLRTQLSKMGEFLQLREFLGRLLEPLIKTGLPLIKILLKPWARSVLIPLRSTAAATDAEIRKKKLKIWNEYTDNDTMIILSEGKEGNMKMVKPLEEFGLLIKDQWHNLKWSKRM